MVLGELEGVLDPDADEVAVEEALYEVDEVIAAAIWCGRRAAVKSLASEADRLVRQVPEPFAQVADLGLSMAGSQPLVWTTTCMPSGWRWPMRGRWRAEIGASKRSPPVVETQKGTRLQWFAWQMGLQWGAEIE